MVGCCEGLLQMSWEQLKAIDEENKVEATRTGEPPVSCPIDGELLQINASGVRNCPAGNYRWP